MMPLGELLKTVGLVLAASSVALLLAGAIYSRRSPGGMASWEPRGGRPARRRLIWRVGESPFYPEAPDPAPQHDPAPKAIGNDTGVSRPEPKPRTRRRQAEEVPLLR